jgi:cyclase
MLRKRIIFTLIYHKGFFTQSRNFRLQKVGDITWLEKNYKFQNIAFSIDELIVLNTSKSYTENINFIEDLRKLVDKVFIPVAAGGGIKTLSDAKTLFKNGADKIVVNSILFTDTKLVKKLVANYGSQSIIASVDYKKIDNTYKVFICNATKEINLNITQYIKHIISLGVGEIYLNSIDRDGTGFGLDVNILKTLDFNLNIPIILAGGAGNEKHFKEAFENPNISAVATANLFNFVGDGLPNARKKLLNDGVNLAQWNQ